MKRTATLLAGLLLVTGTVFASEVKVTGAHVEGTYWLTNSENGSLASEGGDLDLEVKVEKEGKFGTLGLVLQNDKDADDDLRVTYTKTEGDWTVATEALLIDANGDLLGQGNSGNAGDKTSGNMNKGDGIYISWDVMGSKMFKLTYYPYEVGGMSFDEETFESFIGYANPGMKLDVKVNANTNVAFRVATDNGESKTENLNTYKVNVDTKVANAAIKVAAGVGERNVAYVATDDVTDLITDIAFTGTKEGSFVAAQLKMPIAKFTVLAEANMETAELKNATTKIEIDQTAFYLKGSYDMGTYNKYGVTPYASLEVTKWDVDRNGVNNPTVSDTLTEIETGIALNQGSFTVTPKVIIKKLADNKGLDKEESTTENTEKSGTYVGVKFAYSM